MNSKISIIFKVLFVVVIFFILIYITNIIWCTFTPKHNVFVEYSASNQNFRNYFDEIDALFTQNEYNFEVPHSLNINNYDEADPQDFRSCRTYEFSGGFACDIYLSNNGGDEFFSIYMYSPHVATKDYEHIELLLSISDILSGHKFTENDLVRLLEGKSGLHFKVREGDELLKGYRTHNETWVGALMDWKAHFIVNEDHIYEKKWNTDAIDIFLISGFTKTGTKN